MEQSGQGHAEDVPRSQNGRSLIIEQAGRDGYPERVGFSAANTTWYFGSSRTDLANRGSCISLLMSAIVALAGLLGCLLFFLILRYDTDPEQKSVRNSSTRRVPLQSGYT
jgi:hypothetical protein